jgi:hypothetical protein
LAGTLAEEIGTLLAEFLALEIVRTISAEHGVAAGTDRDGGGFGVMSTLHPEHSFEYLSFEYRCLRNDLTLRLSPSRVHQPVLSLPGSGHSMHKTVPLRGPIANVPPSQLR